MSEHNRVPAASPAAPQNAVSRLSVGRSLLVVAALPLALLTQYLFDGGVGFAALPLALVTALAFGWATAPLQVCRTASATTGQSPAPRWRLLGTGLVLVLAAYPLLGPNEFTGAGTLLWVVGLAACGTALWDGPGPWVASLNGLRRLRREGSLAVGWHVLALLAIVAVGAFYRLYALADLPGEQGPDIPLKIQIVEGMLRGERPIWSTIYPGRETLFFYLVFGYSRFFGIDQYALKLMAALCSLLTLPLIYGLAARWFGRIVGLVAVALVAVAPWHIIISRIGYRGVLIPLMIVLTLWALDWVLVRGARRDFVVLGLLVGVGFYTYTAYQIVPLALAIVAGLGFAGRLVRGEGLVAVVQRRWLLAVLLAVLVLLPLARFAVADWENFFFRAGSRITGREAPLPENLVVGVLQNIGRSLGMFNLRGDGAYILNVPNKRTLGFVSGALFILGVGVLLARLRERPFVLLAVFLLVMQLPSALALAFPNEVPASLRASGALVPAYLLAALPLPLIALAVGQWRGQLLLGRRRLPLRVAGVVGLAAVVVALLVGEARENWRTYFVDYADAQPLHNYPITRAIAAAADEYAGEGPVYLRVWPFWTDGNAIRAGFKRLPVEQYTELYEEQFTEGFLTSVAGKAMFVLHPDDAGSLVLLRESFPGGALVAHRDFGGDVVFYTFYGER